MYTCIGASMSADFLRQVLEQLAIEKEYKGNIKSITQLLYQCDGYFSSS